MGAWQVCTPKGKSLWWGVGLLPLLRVSGASKLTFILMMAYVENPVTALAPWLGALSCLQRAHMMTSCWLFPPFPRLLTTLTQAAQSVGLGFLWLGWA